MWASCRNFVLDVLLKYKIPFSSPEVEYVNISSAFTYNICLFASIFPKSTCPISRNVDVVVACICILCILTKVLRTIEQPNDTSNAFHLIELTTRAGTVYTCTLVVNDYKFHPTVKHRHDQPTLS